LGYEGQQLGSGGLAEQHGVLFSQEIVRGGKLSLNRAVADQDIARAQQELAAQEQRLLTDVRVAFYQALVAQRQIDVTAELVHMSQHGLDAANARLRATEGTKVEVLQAQVEAATANLFSQKARTRHQAVWQELSAIVGAPDLPPQPLVGDAFAGPKQFDFRETLVRLQTSSPEIVIAVVNIERAQLALQRAQVESRPNVSLQGLVNVRDNGINGKADGGLIASVPLPLWNKNQGAILQAQHEVAAAQQALSHLELSLQHRLAPVFERYINARNQAEIYRTNILPAAQQSLDLTRQLYVGGEISYINLLTIQRTFSQTNLDYLDALRELRTTEAQIEGLLLSGSFQLQ
jgi:outer membrane protein, heavy metal efflux system